VRRQRGGRGLSLARLAVALGCAAPAAFAADAPPPLEPGRLHASVTPAGDPDRPYALYLPGAATSGRPLPVVFAFDLRDDAAALAEALREGAERFGWIVVAPHGSSNLEATAANAARMSAAWADALARLPVDERRVYLLGFSGMARFVCALARAAPESVAGVIGFGGGFPADAPPRAGDAWPFFGLVGERDFTYYELVDLEARLAALGSPHRFVHWPGSHQRPPPDVAARALAWLELRAIAEGRRAAEPALAAALWDEGVARARAAESEERWLAAEREWRALAEDFAALRDVEPARRRLAELAGDARLRGARAAAERRLRRDRRYLERVPELLAGAARSGSPDAVAGLLAALEIADLRRRRDEHREREERESAERRLYAVYVQAGIYAPRRLADRGEIERAIVLLRVAAEIEPEVPHVRFRLAVAHARLGEATAALAALERAVALGWDDRAAIAGEPAFAGLADAPRFRALLERLPP